MFLLSIDINKTYLIKKWTELIKIYFYAYFCSNFNKNTMKMPKMIKNKYFLTFILFFIYMLFFDSNNLIRQFELMKELKGVEVERKYYMEEINSNVSTTKDLLSDIKKLERYAREKFLMKRADEDVFMIVRPKVQEELEK